MAETHDAWMARAISLSRKGFPAPNPRVGCVIVKDGAIVGEGWHDHAGGPHAEVVALETAGPKAKGADVYVTLEPCAHHGRTPPCTEALVKAGVARVVYAVDDPNLKAAGGAKRLAEARVKVVGGVLADKSEEANRVFLTAVRRRRPFVCVKAAVTADGLMARDDGTSQWITGPAARQAGHRLRAEMGAVLVGVGTVKADDPRLTARVRGVVNQPIRVVLDPRAELDGTEAVFQGPGRTVWVVAEATGADKDQTTVAGGAEIDLGELLEKLFDSGCIGVLVEGGPRTIRRFFDARMVDSLELFVGPCFFGSGAPFLGPTGPTASLSLERVSKLGPDARLTFRVQPFLKVD